jgi:predicted molibdopterin-dependent oxidoreductase YjgC
MPRITIDNHSLEVPDGTSILDAARRAGIEIPTLCYDSSLPARTSCMVCMVRLLPRGEFVPACGTEVVDGMEIESESDDVRTLRREALELLLGDHLGDCEAPCRLAHPTLADIPRMLRAVQQGEWSAAAEYIADHPSWEDSSKAPPYERACRRGRYDDPVAIESIIEFVRRKTGVEAPPPSSQPARPPRPFSVHMGGLDEAELTRQAELALDAGSTRRREAGPGGRYDEDAAVAEAKRCLHCDCRKPIRCRLRHWAERYGASATRLRRPHRPFHAELARESGLVFEPGKCIACGLCVEILREAGRPMALIFQGRGFDVIVAHPPGGSLAEAVGELSGRLVEACPTAALALLSTDR